MHDIIIIMIVIVAVCYCCACSCTHFSRSHPRNVSSLVHSSPVLLLKLVVITAPQLLPLRLIRGDDLVQSSNVKSQDAALCRSEVSGCVIWSPIRMRSCCRCPMHVKQALARRSHMVFEFVNENQRSKMFRPK